MHRSDVVALVLSSVRDLLPPDAAAGPPLDEATPLIGRDAVLDSLGLVELIVDVEQRVQAEHGLALTLADERAMSMRHSPFRTVATLADHVYALAASAAGAASAGIWPIA